MTTKEWLQIPGFDPRYEVSAGGQLRSWAARGTAARGGNKWAKAPRIVPGARHRDGYTIFGLLDDKGRTTSVYMHQLVLAAFVGPLPEGLVTRHRNGDPTDNRLENLTYGTHLENHADRGLHGRTARAAASGKSNITDEIALAIVARYRAGESQMSIAKTYGMGQTTVSDIVNGRTWASVTGIR
jgi:hypothetical protein